MKDRKRSKAMTGKNQTARAREYIKSVKAQGCQLCGYSKCIAAIEFHHVGNDKSFELSSVSSRCIATIAKEIAKCVIVCANCHREIHEQDIGKVNRKEQATDDKQLKLFR